MRVSVNTDSVGCSRSHVHNDASHVHRVWVRLWLGLGLGFVDIRVRVSVRFCGHYVDIVAANCGHLRLQPTVTLLIGSGFGCRTENSASHGAPPVMYLSRGWKITPNIKYGIKTQYNISMLLVFVP